MQVRRVIMKRFSLLFLLCGITTLLFAQGGVISFKSLEHQFGDAQEDGGVLHHTFEFTNKGTAPIIIYGVSTSCGCTASEWTKEPILPGKKGVVTANFDPKGRPYSFSKTLTVRSNAEPSNVVLTIRGYVIPRNATEKDLYAQRIGEIGFRSFYQILGDVSSTSVQRIEVPVHNFAEETKAVEIKDLPKFISGKKKLTLKPNETAKFVLELKAKKMDEWGAQSVELKFASGEALGTLYLHLTRLEDFSHLSAKERERAPHLEIPMPQLLFDACRSGDEVVKECELKNIGKTPLVIRRIITNCSCITYALDKESIPAGESAKLTLTFNTQGYTGEQHRQIYLIVNDPVEPTRSVEFIGTIQ